MFPQCRCNVLLWKSNAWVKMIQVTVHMDCRALASIPGIPAEGWDARHGYATLCHRRTAHALDELHTWDLEHKKEYRKAKPFIFKTCWGHPEMAKGQPQHGTDILTGVQHVFKWQLVTQKKILKCFIAGNGGKWGKIRKNVLILLACQVSVCKEISFTPIKHWSRRFACSNFGGVCKHSWPLLTLTLALLSQYSVPAAWTNPSPWIIFSILFGLPLYSVLTLKTQSIFEVQNAKYIGHFLKKPLGQPELILNIFSLGYFLIPDSF